MATDPANPRARLLFKYATLLELREAREEAEAQGLTGWQAETGHHRRAIFRQLSHEFPGSLRELERARATTLRAKQSHLESSDPAAPMALWASVTWAFHTCLRDALSAKGWLARRPVRNDPPSEEHHRALSLWWPGRPFADAETPPPTLSQLHLFLWPPEGRVQLLVWQELERRFGLPRRKLESLVFGELP